MPPDVLIDDWLLGQLVDPKSGEPLEIGDHELIATNGDRFPVEDGIPRFAQELEAG